jgi:RNA polymerase sigma factor (sigma-70 family)
MFSNLALLVQAQTYLWLRRKKRRIDTALEAAWADFFLIADDYLRRVMTTVKVPRNYRDDVAQEVWAAIVQDLHKFQTMRPFRVWMYKVVRNKKVDAIRHSISQQGRSLERLKAELLEDQPKDEALSLGDEERSEWLVTQLSKEDPENVHLLLAHIEDRKSIKDLTVETGKTEKAIESRIGRLRKKLSKLASETFRDRTARS